MSAFVDTSGLYALLVASEETHTEAVRSLRRLLEGSRTLWTTSYVLVETVALLEHRIGLAVVRDFEDNIVPLLSVVWVSQDLHGKGLARLLREDRRSLSLVDCVSLEFIRSLGLRDVLGLDHHFEEAGCRLLPLTRA